MGLRLDFTDMVIYTTFLAIILYDSAVDFSDISNRLWLLAE